MKKTSYIASALIIVAVLALGYFLFPGEKNQKAAVDGAGNKVQAKVIPQEYALVKDISYDGIKLTDGKAVTADGMITLMPELSAAGDLNADGKNDLVVVSYEDQNQGQSFRNLAVYLSSGETLSYVGKIFLGDTVRVREVVIGGGGVISIKMYTHKPDDFLEAPTHYVEEKYKMANGEVIELGRADLPAENAEKAN